MRATIFLHAQFLATGDPHYRDEIKQRISGSNHYALAARSALRKLCKRSDELRFERG